MATFTKNYNLKKPGAHDPVDIDVLNENFDVIDEKIKEAADAIPAVATPETAGIVKPDGTSITVDKDGTIHGAQTYVLPEATAQVLGGIRVGANLNMGENGVLNAYAEIQKDATPTQGSHNAVESGGAYNMIAALAAQVSTLGSNVAALTTGLNWLEAVSTYDDIATIYPSPSANDTVMCLDTGYAWQYNGTNWVFIFASLVAVASAADVRAVLELTS